MVQEVKRLEFKNGYYFSPGFYQTYWLKYIQDKIPNYDSFSNQKLEQYQELWIGSIFAALYTKSTGEKYYVGLPERDPPDIWMIRYIPVTFKDREAFGIERIPIEITRCHLDEGENLFDQIMRKNKPAYDNTVLLVYLYGVGGDINFEQTVKKLSEQENIYPLEIFVVAKVDGYQKNTFIGMMVYPEYKQQIVDLDDKAAFFSHPSIIGKSKLGVTRAIKVREVLKVLPPEM